MQLNNVEGYNMTQHTSQKKIETLAVCFIRNRGHQWSESSVSKVR